MYALPPERTVEYCYKQSDHTDKEGVPYSIWIMGFQRTTAGSAALEMFEQQDTYESDTQRYFNARNLTHALDWGQYGELQRGDYASAWQAVENGEMVIANTEAEIARQRREDALEAGAAAGRKRREEEREWPRSVASG